MNIPGANTQAAADAIEAKLKEYEYPSNPLNAARAGWEAARRVAEAEIHDNRELRMLLALYAVGSSHLYLDDGEISDSSVHPGIDFKRDSVHDIQERLIQRRQPVSRKGQCSDTASLLYAMAHSHYSQHLRYHNWHHVQEVEAAYAELYGAPDGTMLCAIAYHDSVYVPGAPSGMNEHMSALTFRHAWTRLHIIFGPMKDCLINTADVEYLIEHTTIPHHLDGSIVPERVRRLLDCDLCALAKPWELFLSTQFNILEEQGFTRNDRKNMTLGHQKSLAFLQQFAARPQIFRTAEAQHAYEDHARDNIAEYTRYVKGL